MMNLITVTINADKTATATFALKTFVITPTTGTGGSITPSMPQTVNYGDDITFTVAANMGYHVADVSVDGVSHGAISGYTFNNVTADHILIAAFGLNPPAGLSASSNSPTVLGSMTTLTATTTS